MKSFLAGALDLCFPPICLACSARIDSKDPFLCSRCRENLELIEDFVCPVCGAFDTNRQEDCSYCNSELISFDKCRSLYPYNNVMRTLIHQLKYNEMTKISSYLAEKAVDYLRRHNPFPEVGCISPVPLHPTKARSRGYNQAALITKKIAASFSWTYRPNLIKRTKFTERQSHLAPEERKLNVSKAFSIDRKETVQDYNILIIDDVFTTGATVNSICRLLREQLNGKIYVLTIARA